MTRQEAQKLAATSMSAILDRHGIGHAIIGGFAVNLLGHKRSTVDVDVEIDVQNVSELRGRISQLLTEGDTRFSVEHHKLFFTVTSSQLPHLRVPVETLPIGQLGLPRNLLVMRPGNGTVPVLRPGILVLTKIKRCATLIGSTRPQSILKYNSDVSDINFLLEWLVENDEKADFAGYQSLAVERLYTATADLVQYWKEMGREELVQLMKSVLEKHDWEKIEVD